MRETRRLSIILVVAFSLAAVAGTVGGSHDDRFFEGDIAPCPTADDGGSGRDATSDDPVAIAEGSHAGCLDGDDVEDTYVVHAEAGDRLDVGVDDVEEACGDVRFWYVDVSVLGPEDGTTGGSSNVCSGSAAGHVASVTGEHRITVRGRSLVAVDGLPHVRGTGVMPHPVTYRLDVAVGTDIPAPCDPQDDGASGRDATVGDRVLLGDGVFTGCIDRFDETDGYAVPAAAGDLVRVTLTPHDCGRLFLSGSFAAGGFDNDGPMNGKGACEPKVIGLVTDADAVAAVTVSGYGAEDTYDLLVETAPDLDRACAPQDDAGSGRDATADAPVAVGPTFTGCLDVFDHRDHYALAAEAGRLLKVTFTPHDGCMFARVQVYDDQGWVGGDNPAEHCAPTTDYVLLREDPTVALRVSRYVGVGGYGIDWELCPPGAPAEAERYDLIAEAWCAAATPTWA